MRSCDPRPLSPPHTHTPYDTLRWFIRSIECTPIHNLWLRTQREREIVRARAECQVERSHTHGKISNLRQVQHWVDNKNLGMTHTSVQNLK